MKFCISKVHLGRYRVEIMNEDNQVTAGFDGGSALVMVMLTGWLFEPEHIQYMKDQQTSSDELGESFVKRMRKEFLPPKAKP